MSDQIQHDAEGQTSHQADVEAGFDNDDQADDRFAPAGVPNSDLDAERPDTSHDADVAAGYDEEPTRGGMDDN